MSEIRYENFFPIEGGTFVNAGDVSSRIKSILKNLGIGSEVVRRAAIIAYESEINIVSYALRGTIRLSVTPDAVCIEAKDEGPGIPDIELAMQEGFSTATPMVREMGFGAGMGLSNIKKFSDSLEITSEVGQGTHVKTRINMAEAG